MVRITEEEFTDLDGRVRKVRKIEAARARIEHADGTVEEYSDTRAEEWPWAPDGHSPEWRLFGVPMTKVFELALRMDGITVSLLSENGEIILKIGSIAMGMQMSADRPVHLVGNEVSLDS